ncbi:MAG: hypothetical protein MRZ79_21710 [Bacteroidia bacterium]|nr:hypothetical protein [Bacteroidia bacterium]
MIDISFDIRASLSIGFKQVPDLGYNLLQSSKMLIRPTPATEALCRKYGLLIKDLKKELYILASPGDDLENIALPRPLTLSFFVFAGENSSGRLIDFGPGIREVLSGKKENPQISKEKQNFFKELFPGQNGSYQVGNGRLKAGSDAVSGADLIGPLAYRIFLPKETYKKVKLSGPFGNEEVQQKEDETYFTYDYARMQEGLYSLEVEKNNGKKAKGKFFYVERLPARSPIALVSLSLSDKKVKINTDRYMINFQERKSVMANSNNL